MQVVLTVFNEFMLMFEMTKLFDPSCSVRVRTRDYRKHVWVHGLGRGALNSEQSGPGKNANGKTVEDHCGLQQ